MSIFDKLRTVDKQFYHPNTIRPTEVFLSCQETGNTRPVIDRCTEYAVELRVAQTFWANQAQYHGARDAAIKQLAWELYAPILGHLHHLRTCIASGDAQGAMECTGRIEKEMSP